MLHCLYIDRETNKDNKNKVVEDIIQRQEDLNNGKSKFPLLIFPEGTTSNGLSMMEFKRGAFVGINPIKPITVQYKGHNFHPTYEVLPFGVHVVLILSQLYTCLQLNYLPIFVPNEYLFKHTKLHLQGNKELIYAETIRTVMEESSGIKRSNTTLQDKKDYLEILYNQKGFS